MKQYYVYILSNKNQSVFYIGITNNLVRRIYEHRNKLVEGFTSKYNIIYLLYYETLLDPKEAITREKQIKKYSQKKKINLIQINNPSMQDLYDDIINN